MVSLNVTTDLRLFSGASFNADLDKSGLRRLLLSSRERHDAELTSFKLPLYGVDTLPSVESTGSVRVSSLLLLMLVRGTMIKFSLPLSPGKKADALIAPFVCSLLVNKHPVNASESFGDTGDELIPDVIEVLVGDVIVSSTLSVGDSGMIVTSGT